MTTLILNSLFVSSAATLLAVAFGMMAAIWASGLEARGRAWLLGAAVVALALPPFMVSNTWIALLGQTGSLRNWLSLDIYSLGGTIWLLALMTWPITFFFTVAAWRRVESSQLEVDLLLTGTNLMRWLLLPMARPALVQGAVLTFVLTFNNFAIPALLQVKVFPAELWVSFNTTFDYAAALRLSWPLVLVPLVVVLMLRRHAISWSWRSQGVEGRVFRRQLGGGLFALSATCAASVLLFSALPLVQLFGDFATWREFGSALAAGQSALLHSVGFAAVAATVVVVGALFAAQSSFCARTLLWLPFLIPGVLLGITLIWLLNRPGLGFIYQSALVVILAYTVRYAALGWNSVAEARRAVDRNLIDIAATEGATRWQTFRHAWWPQVSSRVAAAWYVTYLLCLWDVETLVLIVPPGSETLALRIFNLLHYGHNAQINALCLLLLIVAVLPLGIWMAFRKTIETVKDLRHCSTTQLKQGVNEILLVGGLKYRGFSGGVGRN